MLTFGYEAKFGLCEASCDFDFIDFVVWSYSFFPLLIERFWKTWILSFPLYFWSMDKTTSQLVCALNQLSLSALFLYLFMTLYGWYQSMKDSRGQHSNRPFYCNKTWLCGEKPLTYHKSLQRSHSLESALSRCNRLRLDPLLLTAAELFSHHENPRKISA